jgi:hypothetical protein
MVQSATGPLSFAVPAARPLTVDFAGGRLTSDGGLAWLAEADAALNLCAALAAVIPDWRRRRGRHDLTTLLTQRIYQIACGYEDQNDADALRTDPLLKLVCGRLPETDPDLASQPTFSRLETSISATTCYRLAQALGQVYLQERERDGVPERIVLDLDGTDDPTHGDQAGTAYHGYFRQHMYHPLLIFDGETEQLITAVLRPGTVHASHGVVSVLRRVVAAIRDRWPQVTLELRADAGFAVPAVYAFCEDAGIAYTLGLARNPRLSRLAGPLQAAAAQEQTATAAEQVRLLGETVYQADSWPHPRRVIVKAELLPQGPNTRFVVTTRTDPPAQLYAWYTARGATENWIKDLKAGCFADRLSCHRFGANQFRLLLHAAAYWLLSTLRRWLGRLGVARMTLSSLRLRLLKLGGRVRQLRERVHLQLTSHHPGEPLWYLLASRPHRFVNNPG